MPVLLMSGDPAVIENRLDGPVPFLEKPFGLVAFEQAIDGLLAAGETAWGTGDLMDAVRPPESDQPTEMIDEDRMAAVERA